MITSNVSVPTSVAGYVQGFPGLSQIVNTSDATTGVAATAASDASSGNAVVSSKNPPIPPPAGFRNAEPCSTYYGQKVDTTAPAYGDGYPATLPYSPCGYTPQQMENAYGISTDIANGDSGKGETVAIVDAYESATLQADTQEYYRTVDPAIPLQSSQFSTLISPKFDDETLCGANGWNAEQSLDIEAVHAMAPSANIIYVGAEDCINGLLNAEREIVDGNLANIITNSWGDDVGDLLDPTTDQQSYNTLFEEAVATGIGIQFSAGDDGDNFALSGLTAPDFPASSPFVTTVGGTSLEIGQNGARAAEYGWSTSKSYLCTHSLVNIICTKAELGTYVPPAPGAYDYGGGGGTSFQYLQPYYQAGIVPAALAERNTVYGTTNLRVEPDISVDADPTTGFLIGLTQLFGTKAEFGTYRIGGTSLASPLLAGMLADADQAGNSDLGFVNPLIYKLSQTTPGAFYDVKSGGLLAIARSDYVDGIDNADGTYTSIRTVTYEGLEEYCDGTGSCEERDVALTTTPGFDSMTGLGTPSTSFVTDLANS
jgi:subtilase family serine protease